MGIILRTLTTEWLNHDIPRMHAHTYAQSFVHVRARAHTHCDNKRMHTATAMSQQSGFGTRKHYCNEGRTRDFTRRRTYANAWTRTRNDAHSHARIHATSLSHTWTHTYAFTRARVHTYTVTRARTHIHSNDCRANMAMPERTESALCTDATARQIHEISHIRERTHARTTHTND